MAESKLRDAYFLLMAPTDARKLFDYVDPKKSLTLWYEKYYIICLFVASRITILFFVVNVLMPNF